MLKPSRLFFFIGLFAFSPAHAATDKPATEKTMIDGKEVQLARYAKAFLGAGNVRVEVAPYKAGREDGAILLFHGIESDWDGQAVNHRIRSGAYNGAEYVAQYQGKDWHTLYMRNPTGTPSWEMFVPGIREGIALIPSDGAAQLTTPKAIYQEYTQQKSAAK